MRPRGEDSMDGIHPWWIGRPGEGYWLEVTDREDFGQRLATRRHGPRCMTAWSHRLVLHVGRGDVVFHYLESKRAIVGWSTALGRALKDRLLDGAREVFPWRRPEAPTWTVPLSGATRLPHVLPLEDVAARQGNLVDDLMALEAQVGDPLYYPFEIARPNVTRPLPGYLFKLPALFVEAFPQLASAAPILAPASARPALRPALGPMPARVPTTR
jgi:hypothetical protein